MPRCLKKSTYCGGTSLRVLPACIPKSNLYSVGDASTGRVGDGASLLQARNDGVLVGALDLTVVEAEALLVADLDRTAAAQLQIQACCLPCSHLCADTKYSSLAPRLESFQHVHQMESDIRVHR
jgi:hypothetical protein